MVGLRTVILVKNCQETGWPKPPWFHDIQENITSKDTNCLATGRLSQELVLSWRLALSSKVLNCPQLILLLPLFSLSITTAVIVLLGVPVSSYKWALSKGKSHTKTGGLRTEIAGF